MRLMSGPVVPGTKGGNYKYRLFLNEQMIGRGEVVVREK
jgi:flagellar motor switch/type III secretory pathway protein FliN